MSFLGHDGTVYGIGVVEDRHDPEKLGRVRVRWLGIHTEDKQKILTKDLPWSQVVLPPTGNAIAGVGSTSNLIEGSWVFGFAKDQELMQEWFVMGALPGLNTRTAYRGGKTSGDSMENSTFGAIPHARAWNKARGDLKKIQESYNSKTPNSEKTYIDYEKGFYDPTIDLRNVPYPPSAASYGNPVIPHSFTPPKDAPGEITLNDPDKRINRVPNHSDAGGGDHPNLVDLDPFDVALWEYSDRSPIAFVRATHSDVLHFLFKTTRRIMADRRFRPGWIDFGTFRWPDVNTYYFPGFDQEPEGQLQWRDFYGQYVDRDKGREGVIFSTGYLEPEYWSENREYASTGGTYGPAFPVTRDTPTSLPEEDAKLIGVDPPDNRAGWGKGSGEEVGYWSLNGEDYRVPNPRVRWIRKENLTPTERQTVMELFQSGHYGTGVYNISDPDDGRQDIHWKDVNETDLVVVPTPDTNPLAMGGIPISFTDGKIVETPASLWNDATTYFSDPNLSRGEPAKPLLQAGDIVQIAGVRGMQEVNGRIFRVLGVAEGASTFAIELGTMDGFVWSGPGLIKWTPVKDGEDPKKLYESWVSTGVAGKAGKTMEDAIKASAGLGSYSIDAAAVDNANWSEYLGGGVIIPHYPHWSLCWKADMRERQINIGSPDPETGLNAMHWNQPTGDFNARYPYNNVYESESGHIMEYDDTPGAERIHQMHRSGTHYEIDHNGTRTNYVKGDNYDIRLHDDYMYVKGKVVHTFDDEVMIRYNDRADISAAWKLQLWSGGDLDIHSKRNINMKADGDINMQADGHINLHGTTVTPAQADPYRAGTRNMGERSKIRMKAGHVEIEAIGDETKPKQYGVFVQSNQAPIGIKTLMEGDHGNIHIASAWDMELFSWRHQYRTAGKISNPSNIYDYAIDDIYIEAESGNIEITVPVGYLHGTIQQEIDLKSCSDDIRLQAVAADINLLAMTDVHITAVTNNVDIHAGNFINAKADVDVTIEGVDDIMMFAGDEFRVRSTGRMQISSLENIRIQATQEIDIKAITDMRIHALEELDVKSTTNMRIGSLANMDIHSASAMSVESASAYDLKAPLTILGGGTTHIPGTFLTTVVGPAAATPTSANAATSANSAFGPAVQTPVDADPATSSVESKKAWIPELIELLSIDLPNPRPATGTSVTQLALNENKLEFGIGGENILNLHDTIENLQKGLSAYVTKKLPSTDAMKTYEEDQSEMVRTGGYTFLLEAPWSGYDDHNWTIAPLGLENAIRYPSVAPPC